MHLVVFPASGRVLTKKGQLLSNGGCLEVADSMPFRVSDGLPIRLAECQDNNLAQKFALEGTLRSSGGAVRQPGPRGHLAQRRAAGRGGLQKELVLLPLLSGGRRGRVLMSEVSTF